MAIVVPNAALVAVKGTIVDRNWVNVFGVDKGSAALLTSLVANDLATQFELAWDAHLVPNLSNQWTRESITVTDLQNATAPSFTFGSSAVGANAGEAMPGDTSGMVTWRTAGRGPAMRGRTYISGATEGLNSSAGRPTTGWQGLMQDWADAVIANVATTGMTLSVLHRDAHTFTHILSGDARDAWRRQKRRAPRY